MGTQPPPISKRQLTPACIEWQNSRPYSPRFEDIYFSSDSHQAIEEITHVFIQPNRLVERLNHQRDSILKNDSPPTKVINVGELGFGTGLNFLVLLEHLSNIWKTTAIPTSTTLLHYISFEKYPLKREDREQLSGYQKNWFQQLHSAIDRLLQFSPPCIAGIHRLFFPELATQLTLVYGDINDYIGYFIPKTGSIDSWFLDGFAPRKNPDMWQPSTFNSMAKLSTVGTTCSTFTAASSVRQGLTNAGFIVEKKTGFGRKRHMLTATLPSEAASESESIFPQSQATLSYKVLPSKLLPSKLLPSKQSTANLSPTNSADSLLFKQSLSQNKPFRAKQLPWFLHRSAKKKPSNITIIGGGLSGTACAYSLAKRGFQVQIIERHSQPAQEASGNPLAVTFVRFSTSDTPQNRFYQFAYLDAIQHLNEISVINQTPLWHQSGIFQLAYNDKELAYQTALADSACWPQSLVQQLDAQSIQSLCKTTVNTSGLWLPTGGWVQPKILCHSRLNHPNIRFLNYSEALELTQNESGRWKILSKGGRCISESDTIIIANAHDALTFKQTNTLPLSTIRGQITQIPANTTSMSLQAIMCYDGYIGPAINGIHTVGATYHPKSKETQIKPSEHVENIIRLKQVLPDIAQHIEAEKIIARGGLGLAGRTAFRCKTPDYLPIVGPVPKACYFKEAYELLRKGNPYSQYPKGEYFSNLYISVAHGSRGLTTSNFSAELLASYITGEPPNTDREVINAIHPARFSIRNMKRRQ